MLFRTSANLTVRDIMAVQALEGKIWPKGPTSVTELCSRGLVIYESTMIIVLMKASHPIWFSPFIRNGGKGMAGRDECVRRRRPLFCGPPKGSAWRTQKGPCWKEELRTSHPTLGGTPWVRAWWEFGEVGLLTRGSQWVSSEGMACPNAFF